MHPRPQLTQASPTPCQAVNRSSSKNLLGGAPGRATGSNMSADYKSSLCLRRRVVWTACASAAGEVGCSLLVSLVLAGSNKRLKGQNQSVMFAHRHLMH
jgi:hypothetical protein